MANDVTLSNVIGAPFREFVLTQLQVRSQRNTTGAGNNPLRTSDEILFLANKSAWVKLSSSVRFESTSVGNVEKYYRSLNQPDLKNPDDLAKNWILQSGTSIASGSLVSLRSGLGPNGSYGLGGITDQGYRPMPGLSSVQIETKGILGSLREATINFTVWDINQLNVIEALYFRLGYSMLLEWGHTQYFNNVTAPGSDKLGSFVANASGLNPFEVDTNTNFTKGSILRKIYQKTNQTSGNYDGMFGLVQNFVWSFNQEGGYDCTLKIIGLGSIIDSLRINMHYKLPPGLVQQYILNRKTVQQREAEQRAREAARQAQQRAQEEESARQQTINRGLPPIATNTRGVYEIYKTDVGAENARNSINFLNVVASINTSYQTLKDKDNTERDYYYKAEVNKDTDLVFRLNTYRTGLFLNNKVPGRSDWSFIEANVNIDNIQPVKLNVDLIKENFRFYELDLLYETSIDIARSTFISELTSDFNIRYRSYLETSLTTDEIGEIVQSAILKNPFKFELPNSIDAIRKKYGSYTFSSFLLDTLEKTRIINEGFSAVYVYYAGAYTNNPLDTDRYEKPFFFALKLPKNDKNVLFSQNEIYDAAVKALESGILNVYAVEKLNYTTNVGPYVGSLPNRVFNDVIIAGRTDIVYPAGRDIGIEFEIVTNNSAFITKLLPKPPKLLPQVNQLESATSADTDGNENKETEEQKDDSDKFSSSLHAMLNVVKSQVQAKFDPVKSKGNVIKESIFNTTKLILDDSVLAGLLTHTGPQGEINENTPLTLLDYAIKGFNSNLMVDSREYKRVQNVNFQDLCTAYGIPYKNDDNVYSFPIYIKFGYLLAFMNSMCLVYDSKQDTDRTPFVYLDFNPETNLCLSIPQHLCVDPYTCMIPYQGTENDYLKLFPEPYRQVIKDKGLNTTRNRVSGNLPIFKTADNSYRAKTMEILLNVDFLLDTLKRHAVNDSSNAAYLKGFLDDIVTAVNKALGYVNIFRVAYRDDSNTVIIKDDQFVPGLDGESTLMIVKDYYKNGKSNLSKPKYGMLPIFGSGSLVTQMELKTNITTNMSKQIAISAQADQKAVNSTDHSSFSYFNKDENIQFVDAYKRKVQDASTNSAAQSKYTKQTEEENNDQKQAVKFNTHVLSIYFGGTSLVRNRVEFAVNYFVGSMAEVKSTDPITKSAPFIPANLTLTIDGIGGIVIGNAFTIPENRLPRSLTGTDGVTKVGFIVSGLSHTIENNRWTTSIKGQMIPMRDSVNYVTASVLTPGSLETVVEVVNPCKPSSAKVLEEGLSINSSNVSSYYTNLIRPPYDKSDFGVPGNSLTNNEIIDVTIQNRFELGSFTKTPSFFIIHHTGGRGSVEDVIKTFYCRGYPAQYIIDRSGKIYRFMPDGVIGWHAGGGYNNISVGVEIIANNDEDVTIEQVFAAARLAEYLGFKKNQFLGHGQVPGADKLPTEGKKVIDYINRL